MADQLAAVEAPGDERQGQGGQDQNPDEKQDQKQPQSQSGQMPEKQAKELLEEYERTEAPQGLLNFIPRKGGQQDVDKDW